MPEKKPGARPCACGCGELIENSSGVGRTRLFVNDTHRQRGRAINRGKRPALPGRRRVRRDRIIICACGCGGTIKPQVRRGPVPKYLPNHRFRVYRAKKKGSTTMTTSYRFLQHDPSGEVYAVKYTDGVVSGVCGPLHYSDRAAPLSDFEYDTEDIDWIVTNANSGHFQDVTTADEAARA